MLYTRLATLVLSTTLILFLAAPSSHAADDPVKVIIMAGQSNMVGYGKTEMGLDPNYSGSGPREVEGGIGSLRYMVNQDPAIFGHGGTNPLVDSNGDWIIRDDVNVYAYNEDGGNPPIVKISGHTAGLGAWSVNNRALSGPEYGFGQVVGNAMDEDVLIIKVANGGTTLAGDWRSPLAVANRPENGNTVGYMWDTMVAQVNSVLTNLDTHFPEYADRDAEIAGFGWFQGWNDQYNAGFVAEYEANMTDFIGSVHETYGSDLPFVVATTGVEGWDLSDPDLLEIIDAQLAVDALDHVSTVETRGMYIDDTMSPSTVRFHWNHNGEAYYDIGAGMGEAYLALVPEPTSLMLIGAGGLMLAKRPRR